MSVGLHMHLLVRRTPLLSHTNRKLIQCHIFNRYDPNFEARVDTLVLGAVSMLMSIG